jgi:hypothetical protein
MAGGRGVEPLLAESESGVLPLNDPPAALFGNSYPLAAIVAKSRIDCPQKNVYGHITNEIHYQSRK